jgi:putative ABC transport system permease protein
VLGAVYEPNEFLTEAAVSERVFSDNTSVDLVQAVGVTVAEGVSPAEARRAVDAAVADLPTVTVEDQAEFVADQRSQVDQLLNIVLVLLVLSILIAVLGIVNTLALSVVERTRELGPAPRRGPAASPAPADDPRRERGDRAVRSGARGRRRDRLRLGPGAGAAGAGHHRVRAPVGQLAAVLLVAALAGVLAAALPARRAARLDVLQAVAST